jgi:hypothetical protein
MIILPRGQDDEYDDGRGRQEDVLRLDPRVTIVVVVVTTTTTTTLMRHYDPTKVCQRP